MFEWIADPQAWLALATLTALEIVLGIDNIIFLTILVNKVPEADRQRTRLFGLSFAMLTRIGLLLSLAWVMRLNSPLFTMLSHDVTGRDLILIGGGLFLLFKATTEIYESLEGAEESTEPTKELSLARGGLLMIVLQIAIIDIVFSLDSVITAVGMANHIPVMVIAIMLAVLMMMFAAKSIGDFVEAHPSIKMLALAFLLLVGTTLIADGLGFHVPKGYIYFAMAFSVGVEMLNLRLRKKRVAPVKLRTPVDLE